MKKSYILGVLIAVIACCIPTEKSQAQGTSCATLQVLVGSQTYGNGSTIKDSVGLEVSLCPLKNYVLQNNGSNYTYSAGTYIFPVASAAGLQKKVAVQPSTPYLFQAVSLDPITGLPDANCLSNYITYFYSTVLALPNLNRFYGIGTQRGVRINWQMSKDDDVKEYRILRKESFSSDYVHFKTVPAKQVATAASYEIEDNAIGYDQRIEYQLVMLHHNGTEDKKTIILLGPKRIEQKTLDIFPNPVSGGETITIKDAKPLDVAQMISQSGAIVSCKVLSANSMQLPFVLAAGTYFVTLSRDGVQIGTSQIIVK
jgi:hypothetical protein